MRVPLVTESRPAAPSTSTRRATPRTGASSRGALFATHRQHVAKATKAEWSNREFVGRDLTGTPPDHLQVPEMLLLAVTTTVETEEQATQLAQRLVAEKLAACIQIDGPIRSFYVWQGKQCDSHEYRLTIKTLPAARQRVLSRILELHPYDTPEILVGEYEVAHQPYAQWARAQVETP